MEIIRDARQMQQWADSARIAGEKIACVPTMGYLHEGHLSLMREGRRRASKLAVSIFVNPAQFGPNEDLNSYPRDFERDCALMETVPVDVVFAPTPAVMYPPGFQTWIEVTEITQGLCGARRPGHFRGVATVVAKLFNIMKPHLAIFGEKDYQQLRTIERMVRDLNFDVEILGMPTVRERDGLAMSSRNAYLSPEWRTSALAISQALKAAAGRLAQGATHARELREAAQATLHEANGLNVQYLEVVDALTLKPVDRIEAPVLVAIAAFAGSTRLIDNCVLTPPVRHQRPPRA
jgi:pantoate--beta-alanine ligase